MSITSFLQITENYPTNYTVNIIHFKIRIKRVIRHADAPIAQEVALKNNQGNLYRACILHRIAQGLV